MRPHKPHGFITIKTNFKLRSFNFLSYVRFIKLELHSPFNPFITLSTFSSNKLSLQVPTDKASTLFTFMGPLAVDIWLLSLAAFLLESLMLYAMGRFSPYEWRHPNPWRQNRELVNHFTLSNSFWFVTGTLLRQGCGFSPRVGNIELLVEGIIQVLYNKRHLNMKTLLIMF